MRAGEISSQLGEKWRKIRMNIAVESSRSQLFRCDRCKSCEVIADESRSLKAGSPDFVLKNRIKILAQNQELRPRFFILFFRSKSGLWLERVLVVSSCFNALSS